MRMISRALLGGSAIVALSASTALAADCPPVTVTDMQGMSPAYPHQFELAEFEAAGSCSVSFQENPSIAELNGKISGNPATLPAVADRIPAEPLVTAPFDEIGSYGGVLRGLSKATESGTSDLLSIRHVNFVRYSDDLKTVVPNVAKAWAWNDDFTVLTVTLRQGHKWSDGAPFTAADVVFWYEDLILNDKIYPETPSRWLFAGNPMKVEAVDDVTVKMTFPVPTPGIVNRFAVDYGQPFQPKHFLSKMHIKYNPKADEEAKAKGFKDWADRLNTYYGGSDWKDVPSPLLKKADTQVVPTLESHIVIDDTATGRKLVANPFFHAVDTAGNQLPYISQIDEQYVQDKEVQNLKITNGEVTYKQQAIFIEDFPLLKENESRGAYKVELAPGLGENVFLAVNMTHKDEVLREIFGNLKFRQALSLALNREEINEIAYLGQGKPMQVMPAEPATVTFVSDKHKNSMIDHDPKKAKALIAEAGLKDSDGDGIVERPDGKPLVIQFIYSSQGIPVKMTELVRDYWTEIGVRVDLKEVTSDEYRANANNNDLDMTAWKNDGTSGPTISQDVTAMLPPFGDYFNPGNGFEWAAWKQSEGKQGIEPPADVKKLYELSEKFIQVPFGTAESDKLGGEIVDIHVNNLLKIGTVGEILGPVMRRDELRNFKSYTAKTYDFYWAYPYRPYQWYLKN